MMNHRQEHNCEYHNLQILDYAPTGICIIDADFRIVLWNRCLEDWSGRKKEEMEGGDLREYAGKLSLPRYYRRVETIFSGGPPVIFSPQLHSHIFPIVLPNGITQIQNVKVSALPCADSSYYALFTVEDVTELHLTLRKYREEHTKSRKEIGQRKETEEKLQNSLQQKDFLLKEIHHRIKNNLSMIAGLISLQAESVHDKWDIHTMEELEKKIQSISLVHEKLYLSPDLSTFNLRDYLEELIPHIVHTTISDRLSVDVSHQIEPVSTTIDTAIPISMIITELLLNSLKYAFTGKENGFVEIYFTREKNGYMLRVRDNGVGLPKGFDPERTESLGIRLVYNFTEQLDGEIHVSSKNGTEYSILFPVESIETPETPDS